MSDPDLILLEGMPGTGKSTSAQLVALALRRSARAVRWWYEEVVDHPLFGFHDQADVDRLVGELRDGRFAGAVEDAVARWRDVARRLSGSGATTVADGCLLGHLTWSLYWADAPRAVIAGYVNTVAGTVASIDSVVLHLRPRDVGASWRSLAASRGVEWIRGSVETVERSPLGQRLGLTGFDGLVRYWTAFLELADDILDGLPVRRHVVPVAAGGEAAAQAREIELLGLTPPRGRLRRPAGHHTGTYVGADGATVEVAAGGQEVTASGIAGAWPRVQLLPVAPDLFEVRSMPWEVHFAFDADGRATALDISGPPLLGQAAPGRFLRAGQRGPGI